MRKFLSFMLLCFLAFSPTSSEAATPRKHYSNKGGHYVGSYNKKHKGGRYFNPRTGNHYTKQRG
jgi:hypothetical protein